MLTFIKRLFGWTKGPPRTRDFIQEISNAIGNCLRFQPKVEVSYRIIIPRDTGLAPLVRMRVRAPHAKDLARLTKQLQQSFEGIGRGEILLSITDVSESQSGRRNPAPMFEHLMPTKKGPHFGVRSYNPEEALFLRSLNEGMDIEREELDFELPEYRKAA